jgi:hypothetical protein
MANEEGARGLVGGMARYTSREGARHKVCRVCVSALWLGPGQSGHIYTRLLSSCHLSACDVNAHVCQEMVLFSAASAHD